MRMRIVDGPGSWALSLFLFMGTGLSAHATNVSYTFLQGFSESTSFTYDADVFGYQAEVTFWADLGSGTLEEQALGHEWGTSGLGVCNSNEGDFATCISKKNRPAMDNGGEYEWILIQFDEVLRLDSFTVVPDGNQDRDITLFTGWLSDPLEVANASYTDLVTARSPGGSGLGLTRYEFDASKGTSAATVDLQAIAGTEVWGNSILIGASLTSGADRIFLKSVATRVPLPAGVWLFISAIGALAARRKFSQ
jgi:hypothetical protein